MAFEDDETLKLFIEESQEHLSDIEGDLLEIESGGADIDVDLVNKVFRAIHSIKGGSGFFGLDRIKDLAHDMENVLNMIRNRDLVPTLEIVNALLDGADLLNEMVNDAGNSNDVDITEPLTALQAIVKGDALPSAPPLEFSEETTTDATADNLSAAPEEPVSQSEEITQVDLSDNAISRKESATILPALPFEVDADEIMAASRQYEYFYRVTFDTNKDILDRGRTPRDVLQELQQTGAVLGSNIDLDVEDLPPDSETCVLLFATVLEPDFAATLLDVAPEQIEHLSESDLGFDQPDDLPDSPDIETEQPPSLPEEPAPPVPEAPEQAPPKLSPSASNGAPKPESEPKTSSAPASMSATPPAESTLRVHVKLLDELMNLAGELVLTRNQLVQIITSGDMSSIDQASQRLDLITSELQETIMSTRMQPIGIVFSKFRRIVRDMARDLGKNIELILEGEDVELDKTIIEALSDPLTHLVRNGVDHGIEQPDARTAAGKPAKATLKLSAFHEAGQVVIEIRDDGAGIDPERIKAKALDMGLHDRATLDAMSDKDIIRLIFAPGFSTAKEVTDISGRGVGMDVVNTNLTQLGGVIDIDSTLGVGTNVRIKLPLTLAIIPSLLVSVGEERYAIPQVNVSELVRVPPAQVKDRIQKIGDAMVLRLRGDLLPLIRLSDLVETEPMFEDPETGDKKPDLRENLHDRRAHTPARDTRDRRRNPNRRHHAQSAISIVVVATGVLQFGVVVDQLLDSEEIVVKPLDRHLKDCQIYAGATIQGDGNVAMILDVVEIGKFMELADLDAVKEQIDQIERDRLAGEAGADAQSLVLVRNANDEQFAVPLGLVSRIERIHKSQIEQAGGRTAIKYRGGSLVLFSIEEVAHVKPREDLDQLFVIVFSVGNREVGLLVSQIIDTVDTSVTIDQVTFRQPGILGSAIIHDTTTLLIDLFGIVGALVPDWITKPQPDESEQNAQTTVLIVEDSKFFLSQLANFVEETGYKALTAEDGQLALQVLEAHQSEIDLVLTDIEMPNMDGLDLTRAIRKDERLAHLPVIAVTSVAGEAAEQRGLEAGIDSYLIKLDREQILNTVAHYLKNGRENHA